MEEKQRGLYQKYDVTRKDGREISQGCFVLELKDPKARTAILTYAAEIEKEGNNKELAYDLKSWVGRYQKVNMVPATVEKKDPKVDSEREVMLFDQVVLIPNDRVLDEDSLCVVPPDQVDEYKNENDIELPGVLSVDMRNYIKFHEARAKKSQEDEDEDPLLNSVVTMILGEFESSEYTDFTRFWNDEEKKYKTMLKDQYDVVGEKLDSKISSKSPNHSN
jgi:hypothetical protein